MGMSQAWPCVLTVLSDDKADLLPAGDVDSDLGKGTALPSV